METSGPVSCLVFNALASAPLAHERVVQEGLRPLGDRVRLSGVYAPHQCTKTTVLGALVDLVDGPLAEPNRRGLVYFVGHGVQRSTGATELDAGGEDDGLNEYWQLSDGSTVSDDELSGLVSRIHNTSVIAIVSDCCSSGTMVDRPLVRANTNWVTLGAAHDDQDALACSDGGVFTLWGLLPALGKRGGTFLDFYNAARAELQVPGQAPCLHASDWSVAERLCFFGDCEEA